MTRRELKTMAGDRLTGKVQEVTAQIIPRREKRREEF